VKLCEGPGNQARVRKIYECHCCRRMLAETAYDVRNGRRNLACRRCRKKRNEAENPRKCRERRSNPGIKRAKCLSAGSGTADRCPACGALICFTTDGITGQLVAMDNGNRTRHAHQPAATSAEASRARVAEGSRTEGYLR